MDLDKCWTALVVSFALVVTWLMLTATCSMEAAISFAEEAVSSEEAETEAACWAVSLRDFASSSVSEVTVFNKAFCLSKPVSSRTVISPIFNIGPLLRAGCEPLGETVGVALFFGIILES
jgi:hypothetical protein